MSRKLTRFTDRPKGMRTDEWICMAEAVIDSYAEKLKQADALAVVLRRSLRAWRGLEKMPYSTKPESEKALRHLGKRQGDEIDAALAAFDAARGGK